MSDDVIVVLNPDSRITPVIQADTTMQPVVQSDAKIVATFGDGYVQIGSEVEVQVFSGNGAPSITPEASAALYYDLTSTQIYEWSGTQWTLFAGGGGGANYLYQLRDVLVQESGGSFSANLLSPPSPRIVGFTDTYLQLNAPISVVSGDRLSAQNANPSNTLVVTSTQNAGPLFQINFSSGVFIEWATGGTLTQAIYKYTVVPLAANRALVWNGAAWVDEAIVNSIASGLAGTIRTGAIKLIGGTATTIVDNGDSSFTFNSSAVQSISIASPLSNALQIAGTAVNPTIGIIAPGDQTQSLRRDGSWLVTGTVTSVGFSAPASNAFTVTNPNSNALIAFQNVGATPTTVFLRGDGQWQVPTFSTSLQLLNNANNLINNSGANIGVTQWQDVTAGTSTFINGARVRTTNLYLEGTASGTVIFTVAATTNAYTLTWPTAQGGTGQTLINNGAGLLSWGNAANAQFLYQLQDVDLVENNRSQITFSVGNPIDDVQSNVINIEPNIAVTGLAVNDIITPTSSATVVSETVQITAISAGPQNSTNIFVSGDARIWIGTGTFDNPQYQTIFKVTNNIAVGDRLTWDGAKWTNQAVSGTGQSFAYRDDVTYACVDNNGNLFTGIPQQGQSATATITFATPVPANSAIGNTQLTFTSAVPGSFIDGTSLLAFSNPDLFNISLAILDVAAGPTYFIAGEVNGANGTNIAAGTYNLFVIRAIPSQTIQSLVGNATLTSSDNSVLFNTVGQNINLRAASTGGGGAGQATATNVGDYNDAAINEYPQPGGNANLGYIQVGTVSAFTNNNRIINSTTSPVTGGYTFFNGAAQANVPSVIAELGPQRQLFRAMVTGSWSLIPPGYSFYRQAPGGGFILAPVFMRSGGDWQGTPTDLFPGFLGTTSTGLLAPLGTVTPTPFRGGPSGGPRWTNNVYQVGSISTAFAGSEVNQTAVRITLANSATVSVFRGQEVTVPLKNLLSNDYIATEFLVDVNASNSNTIDLILPTGIPIGTGFDQNLDVFVDRNLYIWNAGFPASGTVFTGTAIVECWLEANVWVGSTTGQWPNGFALPASTAPGTQYNLTWTVEVPDGATVTSLMYKMFNEQADSWMAPNAGTQWNNSITVNYTQGGGGGGGSGTVTSVSFAAPASNAFAVTNPTTAASIAFQNVGATPTNVFLRGDGSWQVPAGSTLWGQITLGSKITAETTIASGSVLTATPYSGLNLVNPIFRYISTAVDANGYSLVDGWYSTFDGTNIPTNLIQGRY